MQSNIISETEPDGIATIGAAAPGCSPADAASAMQQLQAQALPLDRLNSMRAEVARFDSARIDSATLQALIAHVSSPATAFNGAHSLPTHSAGNAVSAALQPPAPTQTVVVKAEEPQQPEVRQPRETFPPHFPEKPKSKPGVERGNALPSRPNAPSLSVPTKPRSKIPRRRPRDMSGFAAKFMVRSAVSRKVTRKPKPSTDAAGGPGLDDTQPSMDEKEVAQLLLELNPVRNGEPLRVNKKSRTAHSRPPRCDKGTALPRSVAINKASIF